VEIGLWGKVVQIHFLSVDPGKTEIRRADIHAGGTEKVKTFYPQITQITRIFRLRRVGPKQNFYSYFLCASAQHTDP